MNTLPMESPIAEVQHDQARVIIRMTVAEIATEDLRHLVLELQELLRNEGARNFVFCFASVEFLPSACLALLLMFHQDVQKHKGRIVLLNCQENVALLIRLARLDALFELAEGTPTDIC